MQEKACQYIWLEPTRCYHQITTVCRPESLLSSCLSSRFWSKTHHQYFQLQTVLLTELGLEEKKEGCRRKRL